MHTPISNLEERLRAPSPESTTVIDLVRRPL